MHSNYACIRSIEKQSASNTSDEMYRFCTCVGLSGLEDYVPEI